MEVKTASFEKTSADTSMTVSGAEAVIKCLLEEGVETIYGYPGGAIMPVYDELYKYQDKIHHVLTRHEQAMKMMILMAMPKTPTIFSLENFLNQIFLLLAIL